MYKNKNKRVYAITIQIYFNFVNSIPEKIVFLYKKCEKYCHKYKNRHKNNPLKVVSKIFAFSSVYSKGIISKRISLPIF